MDTDGWGADEPPRPDTDNTIIPNSRRNST